MGAIDSGNTAWILTSASLVFLMTPGVAFFYGGMVRAKAVLNMPVSYTHLTLPTICSV